MTDCRPADAQLSETVERVAVGVHRISLPLPNDALGAVNVYAIEDGDGLVLIDGGWALEESLRALESAVGLLGHELSAIKRFLVTHVHRDHLTLALTVRRLFGSRVEMGAGERPSLAALREGRSDGPFRDMYRWGAPELADAREPLGASMRERFDEPDAWIEDESRVELGERTLLAVATPGHTRGHMVFADLAAGLLFAGDHILPRITPSIGYEPIRPPHPLRDYLRSLQAILARPDLRLLPAHGQVADSSHQRASELVEHHENRLAATAVAVGGRRLSAAQVASELSWTKRLRTFDELTRINQALAVGETAAHLDVLVARGELHVVCEAGVDLYEKAPRVAQQLE